MNHLEPKYCTFYDLFIRDDTQFQNKVSNPILNVLSLSVMAAETELEIGRQRLIILLSRNHLRGPLLKMIWSIFHGCRHKKLFLFTFQTLPGKYDKSSLKVWDSGLSYNHKTQFLMQFFVSIFKMKCKCLLLPSIYKAV